MTSDRPAGDRVRVGISSAVCAVLAFSIVDAIAKWLGQTYAPIEIVFFRYVFGLLPVAVFVWQSGGMTALATRRPLAHVMRGGFLFLALLGFFSGIRVLPLAEAIAIAFTAPLFVTTLSAPVLGERVGPRRWAAVLVGLVGALIMVRPRTAAFQLEALYILASAMAFACMVLLTRRMTRTETNAAMVTYSTICAGLLTMPFLPAVWRTPVGGDWLLFVTLGIIGGAAAYLVIQAYRNAPVAVVAPFDYTALIWATLFGWVFWREQPGPPVWIGAGIVCLSSIYVTHREAYANRVLRREAA